MFETATTADTRNAYARAHEARGDVLRAMIARLFQR